MAEKNNDVQGLLGVSMDKIKQMVDVNTIIGEPITVPGGTVLIPVSKVAYRLHVYIQNEGWLRPGQRP